MGIPTSQLPEFKKLIKDIKMSVAPPCSKIKKPKINLAGVRCGKTVSALESMTMVIRRYIFSNILHNKEMDQKNFVIFFRKHKWTITLKKEKL